MDGILNIDKPAGKTSFGVVAVVKRLTGERRAGHAGTLDPEATGVLPVCLGKGTRIIEFLADTAKVYRARIELGKATDTYDVSGKITQRGDPSDVDIATLKNALESFCGVIQQTPPMYSAIKHKGKPLYALARAGISIERKSRAVYIHRLELVDWRTPLVTIEIECGKGTYIRSLAHDLGQALGCGAYLKELVRARYGIFGIEEAISLTQLEEACKRGDWQHLLHPIDNVLQDYESITLDEVPEKAMKNGSLLTLEVDTDKKYLRAYNRDGLFLGILQRDAPDGTWRPKKVLV